MTGPTMAGLCPYLPPYQEWRSRLPSQSSASRAVAGEGTWTAPVLLALESSGVVPPEEDVRLLAGDLADRHPEAGVLRVDVVLGGSGTSGAEAL